MRRSASLRPLEIFTASLLPFAAVAAQPSGNGAGTLRSRVIVLAHRSCWGVAPENSVAAVDHCKVIGADAVEMDVRESRDGVLVVMHDDTVDRTTNGTGLVADKTVAELHALRLKVGMGGPSAALTDQYLPTVAEGLAAVRANGLTVNLHLKVSAEAKVAALVKHMNMVGRVTTWVYGKPGDKKLAGAVLVIPTINECGVYYPEPCWTRPVSSLEGYAPLHPFAFFVDYRQTHAFLESVAHAARPAGSRLFVETLNTVDNLPREQRHAEWRCIIGLGFTEIMTNQPEDLIDVLNALPATQTK